MFSHRADVFPSDPSCPAVPRVQTGLWLLYTYTFTHQLVLQSSWSWLQIKGPCPMAALFMLKVGGSTIASAVRHWLADSMHKWHMLIYSNAICKYAYIYIRIYIYIYAWRTTELLSHKTSDFYFQTHLLFKKRKSWIVQGIIMDACMYVQDGHGCMWVCNYVNMHVYICMHIYIHIYVYMYSIPLHVHVLKYTITVENWNGFIYMCITCECGCVRK